MVQVVELSMKYLVLFNSGEECQQLDLFKSFFHISSTTQATTDINKMRIQRRDRKCFIVKSKVPAWILPISFLDMVLKARQTESTPALWFSCLCPEECNRVTFIPASPPAFCVSSSLFSSSSFSIVDPLLSVVCDALLPPPVSSVDFSSDQLVETVKWLKMIFQSLHPPLPVSTARHEAQVLDHSQAQRDEGDNDGWSLFRGIQI